MNAVIERVPRTAQCGSRPEQNDLSMESLVATAFAENGACVCTTVPNLFGVTTHGHGQRIDRALRVEL